MTNLGPLTTAWTPPASCTTNYFSPSKYFGWVGVSCTWTTGRARFVADLDCWPPRTYTGTTPRPLRAFGYYSPGAVCPDGYTPACSQTGANSAIDYLFAFPPAADETALGCCPSGYQCSYGGSTQTCISLATSTSWPTVQCITTTESRTRTAVAGSSGYVTAPMTVRSTSRALTTYTGTNTRSAATTRTSVVTVTESADGSDDDDASDTPSTAQTTRGTATTTSVERRADVFTSTVTAEYIIVSVASAIFLRAPLIQLMRQETDPSFVTPTSASQVDSPSGSRLSGGAIAGVVVGVLAAIALVGAAGYCFLAARKRRAAQSAVDTDPHRPGYSWSPSGTGQDMLLADTKAKTGGGALHEMPGAGSQVHEAPGSVVYTTPTGNGYTALGRQELP